MDLETIIKQTNEAPKALTELMEKLTIDNEKAFKQVLRGFPEKGAGSYGGDIGVCYFKKTNFESDFDETSLPESIDLVLAVICKGTKTVVHDKITKLSLDILQNFLENPEWYTLKDNVESTVIQDHEIFIEQNKNTLLTTAIFELKCDLQYFELENNMEEKSIHYEDSSVSIDD